MTKSDCQNSQKERGDIKTRRLLSGISLICGTRKYGSTYCLLGREDCYATADNPQCPHPEGQRYEKCQELSKMMLDILIPNCNFITRYFSVKALSSTLKEKWSLFNFWGQPTTG